MMLTLLQLIKRRIFFLLKLIALYSLQAPTSSSSLSPSKRIFFSHDGGVDDYLALQILAIHELHNIVGIAVTGADSFMDPAINATAKILDLVSSSTMGYPSQTITRQLSPNMRIFEISGARPAHSSFPDAWRRASIAMDLLPVLNEQYYYKDDCPSEESSLFIPDQSALYRIVHPGQTNLISDQLGSRRLTIEADAVLQHLCNESSASETTWVEVGPLTLLAEIASHHSANTTIFGPPGSGACITSIYWMGGAFSVEGNVSPFLITPSSSLAEWNVFWDPVAASYAMGVSSNANADFNLVPLDVTNSVPITREFLLSLSEKAAKWRNEAWRACATSSLEKESLLRCASLSELAGAAYALAYRGHDKSYFMWDVLTVASFLRPDLVEKKLVDMKVVVGNQPESGQTRVCSTEDLPNIRHKCSRINKIIQVLNPSDLYNFAHQSLTGLCRL